MHTFALIAPLKNTRLEKREKLLKGLKIEFFSQIILNANDPSINAVRQAQKRIQLSQEKGKFQALIIENIENFSLEAQQALLKTLEEPPKNTIIIIESENKDQILPTILSRSQIIIDNTFAVQNETLQKELTGFWAKTLRAGISQRLIEASTILTKFPQRADLTLWCDQQIIFFRKFMVKRAGEESSKNLSAKQLSLIIRLLFFTKKNISGNVNLKLLFDYLFINLPSV